MSSKFMSLEAVNKKLKQLGLEANKVNYQFYLQLKLDRETVKKQFEAWKTTKIAQYTQSNQRAIDHYAKYYPGLKPILNSVDVSDNVWMKRWKEHLLHTSIFERIKLDEGQSSYSCAISEIGHFIISKTKINNYWEWLFRFYIASTKFHYLKCATPVKPMYAAIRKGLKAAGFEMRAKEKSNHGKYFVEVWEFIKPQEKTKK